MKTELGWVLLGGKPSFNIRSNRISTDIAQSFDLEILEYRYIWYGQKTR